MQNGHRRRARQQRHANFRNHLAVARAGNGFDPHEILRDFDWGTTRPPAQRARCCASGSSTRSDREIEVKPRRVLCRLDLQRPHPRARRCAPARASVLRITFINGSAHPHTIHFHGVHPAEMDGVPGMRRRARSSRGGTVYEFDALPAGPAPLPLPRPPAGRAHRQGPVRRVHRRPGRRPRGRRRAGDGDERLRHQLRPRERGLRGQHGRLRLHGPADRPRVGDAGAGLHRQRARVRPHQLVPPARELVRPLPDRHRGRRSRADGHRHALPGPAGDRRMALRLPRPLHVPRAPVRVHRELRLAGLLRGLVDGPRARAGCAAWGHGARCPPPHFSPRPLAADRRRSSRCSSALDGARASASASAAPGRGARGRATVLRAGRRSS